MKKRGFTLIELLAVIVILAIIALIATPIILNIIEDSRRGAAKDSAYGYIEAVEYQNSMNMINKDKYPLIENGSNIDISTIKDKVNLKGTKPTSGNITVEKGRVTKASLCIDSYKVDYDGSIVTKVVKDNNCENNNSDNTETKIDTYYSDGTIIYYNPVENKKCTDYTDSNSVTNVKTGCMKWYAFGDKESGEYNLKMILDHNTTNTCSITDDTTSTPPADKLNNLVESLKNDSKWSVTPRMITMEELTTIMKLEFNSSVSKKYSGLSNDYSWLVPKSTDNTFGYWTATEYASDNTKQWYISLIPEIDVQTKSYGRWGIGFRPVIEISKSNLK